NVIITDVLPAGISFVSASNPQGTATQTNGTVTCTIANLARNASATITITIRPTVEATVTNTVTVNSSATDPILANNSASVTSQFLTAGQLVVLPQNFDFGTLALGSDSQGTFLARNAGSVVVTNVTLSISAGPFRLLSPAAFIL